MNTYYDGDDGGYIECSRYGFPYPIRDRQRQTSRFNLNWRVFRGRTRKVSFVFKNQDLTPFDISNLMFFFTMRSNYSAQQGLPAIVKNPIANVADPTQGQLLWYIEDEDTLPLDPANYVFDVGFARTDARAFALCGGVISLLDTVTEPVFPSTQQLQLF